MQKITRPRTDLPNGWGVPVGVGIGAAIGLIFGQMLGLMALGMVTGAAVGLVTGTVATVGKDVPANRRRTVLFSAVAIAAAGVIASTIILLA